MSEQRRIVDGDDQPDREYRWDQRRWTWTGEVDPEAFTDLVDRVAALTSHCTLEISPAGIHVMTVDAANVAMVETHTDQVERIDGPVGVTIDPRALKRTLPGHHGSLNYHLTISHATDEDDADTLEVQHPTEGSTTVDALEPSMADPDIGWPEVDYQQSIDLPAFKLRGVLAGLAGITDGFVTITPRDGALHFEAFENVDVPADAEWTIDADCVAGGGGRYSMQFLEDIAAGLDRTGTLTLRLGDEVPLEVVGDQTRHALAPRLSPERGDDDD